MKQIRLSLSAEADLDEIWAYIATQSGIIEVADKVIESLESTIRLLSRNPSVGRKRDDLQNGLRCLPSDAYMIYYKVVRRDLFIVRILHGMRNQQPSLSQNPFQ